MNPMNPILAGLNEPHVLNWDSGELIRRKVCKYLEETNEILKRGHQSVPKIKIEKVLGGRPYIDLQIIWLYLLGLSSMYRKNIHIVTTNCPLSESEARNVKREVLTNQGKLVLLSQNENGETAAGIIDETGGGSCNSASTSTMYCQWLCQNLGKSSRTWVFLIMSLQDILLPYKEKVPTYNMYIYCGLWKR